MNGGDRGSIAPMVSVVGVALLLVAGLVIDSSRVLTAKARATAYAEEAARAGAAKAREDRDTLRLDEPRARGAVADYCAAARAAEPRLTGCGVAPGALADAASTRLRVDTTIAVPASLLGIVGFRTFDARGVGVACPVLGLTDTDYVRTDGC